jgi:tetratricopeptide (TPR) repeat protein
MDGYGGRTEGDRDRAHELESLWVQLGRTSGRARAELLDELADVLARVGRVTEAHEAVAAAREIYVEIGAELDVARCDHNAGVVLGDLDRRDDAIAGFRHASAGYSRLLRWPAAASSLRAAGELLIEAGRVDEALDALLTAAAMHEDGDEPVRAALARFDAVELLLTDDPDDAALIDAELLLVRARVAVRGDGALLWVARADQLHAELARRRRDWDRAFELLESARAVFDAADMVPDRDRCDDLWCAVLIDAGQVTEAVDRLERNRATRQSEGDPVGVAWCDLHLSSAFDRLGDTALAVSVRRRARAVFDAAGLDVVLRRQELQLQ